MSFPAWPRCWAGSPLPEVVVIDGYVWLGDELHPGLGAHLGQALRGATAIIGVAKKPFRPGPSVRKIMRGTSSSPLFITAAGMELEQAAGCVRAMDGRFRIPTLLKRVDHLARGCAASSP